MIFAPRKVEIWGVYLGASEVRCDADRRGVVRADLRFRPYWPGIWHLQALAADRMTK